MRLFFQFRSLRPIAALLCLLSAAVMAEGLPYIQAGGAEARITSGIVVTGIDRGDAGNRTGTYAFANPIGAVLSSFNVTVDGK
jgi:hypothetical protein